MNHQLTLKDRFFISSLLFGLALAAVLALVALPALKEIRLINRQVYDERVRLEKLYVRGQLQKKVRDTYARIAPDVGWLDTILLTEGDELPYIAAVEKAANESGVELKINAGERKRTPNQPLSTLTFTLNASGDWPALARFLEQLELLPYYTNIKESTFAVRDEATAGRITTATLTSETYWLVPQ